MHPGGSLWGQGEMGWDGMGGEGRLRLAQLGLLACHCFFRV